MSALSILSPQQSLISHIVSMLDGQGLDFSRHCIVFPGKRPAHFIRTTLAGRLQSAYIPPQLFSIDTFVEHLLREQLGVRSTPIDSLDATALLYEIHCSLPNRIGGSHFISLDRFIPIGLKLFAELEELKMAAVSVSSILGALGRVPYGNYPSLPHYYEAFYRQVADREFTTRAVSYDTLVQRIQEIDFSQYGSIVIAGFYAFASLEARMIKALYRLPQTHLIFQEGPGLRRQLEALDLSPDNDGVPEQQNPTVKLYKAADTHGQIFALNQQMKDLLDSGTPLDEKTVIVLPAPDALFPVIHQPLALLDESQYNISMGYPLERTPLFGFLTSLMNVVLSMQNGKVSAASYMAFALHPYTKNIRFGTRSDVTRVLFHAIEDHIAGIRSKVLLSLEELENSVEVFDQVCHAFPADDFKLLPTDLKEHLFAIHSRTLRTFMHLESVEDFANKLIDVIQYINDRSTAQLHPLFHRYAESFLTLFTSMTKSLLREKRFETPHGYAQFLQSAVASRDVPFPGTPVHGVQVLGLLETRGLHFDRVYMLDVCDDIIPGNRGQHLLLPQPLREVLGMETHAGKEQLMEYYVTLLLNSAREVHLFFTEDGHHEKSRFIEKILWRQAQKNKSLADVQPVNVIRYRIDLSTRIPAPIPKSETVTRHLKRYLYNATALDTYLRCPIQFYYRYVLRLKEKEEVASDIETQEIGTLVHGILKELFSPTVGRTLLESDPSLEHFEHLVEEQFSATYGKEVSGPLLLMKQRLHQQLLQFIEQYQRPMAKKHKIVITGVEQILSASMEGYNFTGRVDRIEERDGKQIILDYKIRHDDTPYKIRVDALDVDRRETWTKAIGSLQLPLYALLYSQAAQIPIENITPGYLLLGKNRLDTEIEACITDDPGEQTERLRQLDIVIHALLDEITSEQISFTPTDDLLGNCPQCPYSTLCGTQWVHGREMA
ncbi:MAG: PD-(D/E)XK nuclease family protein [bacterium]